MAGVHAMMIGSGGNSSGSISCGDITVNALYLKPNGVTIAAIPNAACGRWHTFKGKDYYIAKDYVDLVSVVNIYKVLVGAGEVLVNLTRDGQTKSIPLNQVVTTFVKKFGTGSYTTGLFYSAMTFNQTIASWDTSNVTNMYSMFGQCLVFDQDISAWNVSNVTDMSAMFGQCFVFDQDISGWCVSKIPTKPNGFDQSTPAAWTTAMKPKWGAPCS